LVLYDKAPQTGLIVVLLSATIAPCEIRTFMHTDFITRRFFLYQMRPAR